MKRFSKSPARTRIFARSLMDYAEQTASRELFDASRLDAFEGNPAALGLYDRLGYRRAGVVSFRKGRFQCLEKRPSASLPE